MNKPLRLAMWSGPRNISTAMMRAWENRVDTVVWDEPLYAYYLAKTGLDHPGCEQVIAAGIPDWQQVAMRASGVIPEGKTIFYQKHMSHHLLPEITMDWILQLQNCFLIRDPREVLVSYVKTRENVTLEDIGIAQQVRIFETLKSAGESLPLVIESSEFLQQPRDMLVYICEHYGIAFSDNMLTWPPGKRDSDGVWGPYWYDSVWQSTGFAPYRARRIEVPEKLKTIAAQALPYYELLQQYRVQLK